MSSSRFITLTFLIFIAILILSFLSFHVSAAGTHGVNGFVYNCNPLVSFEVNGANVTFNLYYPNGTLKSDMTLDAIVGEGIESGWYVVDIGKFDPPWNVGDIVLINISKNGYMALAHVNLTEAGNDQAFTVCLGPEAWNFTCACGNDICEWWKPLCENEEFEVEAAFGNITTKRCPEDCGHCICGNGICQSDCGEDAPDSPTYCPLDCYCGDGTCQPDLGENPITCPVDCPETIEGVSYPEYVVFAVCGNKKCEGAETQDNCCQDCGCPEREGCHIYKCMPEYKWRWFRKIQVGPYKCRESCCWAGYCCVWLGLCWYAWIVVIIAIAIAITIYILTRPNLEKIARRLAKIRKTKNLIAADKITKANKFIKLKK